MPEALVKKSEREERQLQYVGGISTVPGSYEPENLRAAMDLAQVLCGNGLVPKALENNPGAVLNVIAMGREMGLGWPSALQNLYVVNGRISAYAEFQRGRIMKHPDCEMFEWIEITNTRAAAKVKKPLMDEPAVVEFTIEDAITARLAQRLPSGEVVGTVSKPGADPKESNWAKYTADMLVARVTTRVKGRYFPYVLTDLPTVEEMQDLPEEKNVTPKADLAAERAETIAAAAGRKVEPRPDPEAAKKHAAAMAEEDVETDEETPQEPATRPQQPPDDTVEDEGVTETPETEDALERGRKAAEEQFTHRIPDALRKKILELDGIGPKVLTALEEAGLVTARHIWRLGVPGLAKTPGIGEGKAKTLHAWANGLVDEEIRAEALAPKEEAAQEGAPAAEEKPPAPAAEKPVFFRTQEYVRGLAKLAEEQGVTKDQLRAQLDNLSATVDLPAGVDPRALPDPQWKTLWDWVRSAKQEALPLAGEEAPAEKETAEAPAVISEKRAGIVASALRKIAEHFGEDTEAAEGWEADFYAFPGERWEVNKIEAIPEAAYQEVLAYMTENDPR